MTVIKDCANRYFLSFVVEIEPIQIDAKNPSIGIDLGIKTFAVMSNGEKAESPNYKELERKIRQLQKKLARQPKDSKRRNLGVNSESLADGSQQLKSALIVGINGVN